MLFRSTGASGGIGIALCRQLAGQVENIAIAYDRNAERAEQLRGELADGGHNARTFACDMADDRAPQRLFEEVSATLGQVDIVVVNHGTARVASYAEVDATAFDMTLAVNLRAPYLLARAALPAIRERGFGRILFISSVAALRGGVISPDYAASKAGLHGLAHYLARAMAADGVTVNVLAPGLIDTPMLPDEIGRAHV